MKKKRVLVFGVFDFLHGGHLFFLRSAKRLGEELVVVVARDSVAQRLKGRRPVHSERKRVRMLRRVPFVSSVVLGDAREGIYSVLKKRVPHCIAFGYDQKGLCKDIKARMKRREIPRIPIKIIRSRAPHRFKSSLYRGKKAGHFR